MPSIHDKETICLAGVMACETCKGPGKVVWLPSAARPHLSNENQAEWFDLIVCQDCEKFWVQFPHEPYASYLYLNAWPYSRAFWNYVAGLQDGLTISKWYSYKIREAWPSMSGQERCAVEYHRILSLGRDSVEEVPGGEDQDPLELLLPMRASVESQA